MKKGELEKILKLVEEETVTVQVIPFGVGAYAAADSNFDYLEFEVPELNLVYIEGLAHESYLDRRADLERYREALDYLRDAALSPRESRKLIEELSAGYRAD